MTDDDINKLAAEAGLGARSTKKLLDANRQRQAGQTPEATAAAATGASTPPAKGHGAPSEDRRPIHAF